MAGNKTTTYTINFKAQYEDVQKLNKILNDMQSKISNGLIQSSSKTQAHLTELIASAKNLQTILSNKIDPNTGMINSADLKNVDGIYNGLIKKVETLKRTMLQDVRMPESLKREIEDLGRELDALTAKQKAFQEQLKRAKGAEFEGVQIDKQSNKAVGISKTRTNQLANQTASKHNLVSVTGKEIKTLQQIEAVIKRIKDLQAKADKTTKESAWLAQYEAQLPQYEQVLQSISQQGSELVRNYNMVSSQMEQNGQRIGSVTQLIASKTADALAAEQVSADAHSIVTSLTQVEHSMELGVGQAVTELKTKQQEYLTQLDEEARKAKEAAEAERKRKEILNSVTSSTGHAVSATDHLNQLSSKSSTTFGKAFKMVFSYGTALNVLRSAYKKLIATVTEMDKALTNMTVVTNLSREQAWGMVNTMHELGRETGMASTEIANMTTMYLQQGKSLSDALELTEAAAKAARIAGINGSESINLLTNAMNGFQIEASKAMEVSDKFAALAASAATDYEELATALSKVAAQANLAGMSMDFTLGLLTKGIEVTREAPETIGTALKTVISRMRELTDYSETLEDGMDVNRVEKALKNIGVALLDDNREFRDLDDVLTEVGMKWDTLNKNQQANVAVALAGTRQQSRLIAMMQDFDRTQELVTISMESAGATAAQHRKYMQGLEAATTNLTISYQQLITAFTNSDLVVNLLHGVGDALQYISEHMGIVYTALAAIGVITGVVVAQKMKSFAIGILETQNEMKLNKLRQDEEKARARQLVEEIQLSKIQQEQIILAAEQNVEQAKNNVAKAEGNMETAHGNVLEAQSTQIKLENMRATVQQALATNELALAEAQRTGDAAKVVQLEKSIAIKKQRLIELDQDLEKNQETLTEAEKEHAEAREAYTKAQEDQRVAEQKLKAERAAMEKLEMLEGIAQSKLELALQAGQLLAKQKLNAESLKTLAIMGLTRLGIDQETASKIVNNAASKLSILLSKQATAAQKKQALATIAQSVATKIATVANLGLAAASKVLTVAINNIPIIGWILAIIGLVIALVQAISKTGAFTEMLEVLKSVGKAVMDIINALFKIITMVVNLITNGCKVALVPLMNALKIILVLIEYVVAAVQFVIDIIQAVMTAIQNLGKTIMNLIPGGKKVTEFFNNLGSSLKNGLDAMKKWCKNFTDNLSRTFETAEDRSKRYAEEIAAAQETIYDNQQKSKTLTPLIEEYEALSQKANKSAEDLERLQEIKDEIKQVDESYITANGQVDWSKVKGDVSNLNAETDALLKENKSKAMSGIMTGYDQAEFSAALSDFYSAEAIKKVQSGELTSTTASAIANNLETAFANLDYDAVRQKYEDELYGDSFWDGLTAGFRKDEVNEKIEQDFDALANSVTAFETELADTDGTMTSRIQAFAAQYDALPDTMKEGFSSIYSIYKEYYDLMANLDTKGKEGFTKNLETLGLTESGYNDLKTAYLNNAGITKQEGESDEAFAARQQEAWESYFNGALGQGEKTREDMIKKLTAGQSTEVANAIESALVPTNQAAIETYMKASSNISNLQEASKKAAAGTLSLDEMRQIAEENPELFANQEQLEKFMKGEVDITAERDKARKALEDDLSAREAFLQQRLSDLSTDDPMYENYKAQLNLLKEQQKIIQYSDLMSSHLWTTYCAQTKEMQKQIRIQAQLNDLQKERDKLNEKDANYGQKKLELLAKERALYKAQLDDANKILNSDEYKEAKEEGIFEVTSTGETIYNAEKAKELYGSGQLSEATYQFLINEDTEELIKDAIDAADEANEGLADNIEEMRSVAEWQYEKEKEILNKRKEEYEQYWDQLDALEDEQERAKSKDDVLRQLSSISGGSDAASNSLRRDLLKQLEDLNKEEAEARKEEMRDAITRDIDDHVASIDEKIDNLQGLSEAELTDVLTGMKFDVGNYTLTPDASDAGSFTFTAYKTGGLVDYTGPAWVDGTKSKPEAFLSANDTKLIANLIKALSYGKWNTHVTEDNAYGSVVVENINITTNQLNTQQDFQNSGQIFAEEFAKIMRQRGLNPNVKK